MSKVCLTSRASAVIGWIHRILKSFSDIEGYILLYIVWHFNKIVVWISEVKRGDGPHGAAPLHWTVLYLDTTCLQQRQQKLSNLVSPTIFPNWNKMRHTKSKRPQVALKDLTELWLTLIIQEALEESGWNTIRCAATVARGVLVMRHRSAEPEVGCLALGSNSWPSWWRLNFCWPKPRALRFPLEMQRGNVLVLTRCLKVKNASHHTWSGILIADNQRLPSSGCFSTPQVLKLSCSLCFDTCRKIPDIIRHLRCKLRSDIPWK